MKSLLATTLLPALALAHGHVDKVVADGVTYDGWVSLPTYEPSYARHIYTNGRYQNAALKYQTPIPPTVGWQADNLDNGFVSPDAFATAAIACHKSSKSNGAAVTVKAGSKVTLKWDTWPVSHAGPILDYLAPVGSSFDVSATSLLFTKIAASAWKSGSNPGSWVTDDLVKNNFSWDFTVPANLAAGNYVLRHEIIALHAAGQVNGAQAYPQCINLKVTGGGSETLSGGTAATSFYKATDPGIVFSLYGKFDGYTIPGPAVKKMKREERVHARDF
jgi:cellulase